jgi:hypothetical protein
MKQSLRLLVGIVAALSATAVGCSSPDSEVLTTFCNLYIGMTREQVRESMGDPNDSRSDVDVWWYKNDLKQVPPGSQYREAEWTASVGYTQNVSSAMWVVERYTKVDLPCPDMRE